MPDDKAIMVTSGCNVNGSPFVHYRWGEKKCQFTPSEARQHALSILHCAEAAEHDAMVFQFVQDRLEISKEEAAVILGDLRNFRTGTGGNENPKAEG